MQTEEGAQGWGAVGVQQGPGGCGQVQQQPACSCCHSATPGITTNCPTSCSAHTHRALYHCNYCHRDISDNIRIKCATCADFDLCVECFGIGVEINGHTNDHTYKVMDNLSFPIFHPNWGVS